MDEKPITKGQPLRVYQWLGELHSHEIYDSVGMANDFKEKTGLDPCWGGGWSHKEMTNAIKARGLGGNLKPDNGHQLIAGYEVAEALADKLVPGKSRHPTLYGRGSRFWAALEALKAADV